MGSLRRRRDGRASPNGAAPRTALGSRAARPPPTLADDVSVDGCGPSDGAVQRAACQEEAQVTAQGAARRGGVPANAFKPKLSLCRGILGLPGICLAHNCVLQPAVVFAAICQLRARKNPGRPVSSREEVP